MFGFFKKAGMVINAKNLVVSAGVVQSSADNMVDAAVLNGVLRTIYPINIPNSVKGALLAYLSLNKYINTTYDNPNSDDVVIQWLHTVLKLQIEITKHVRSFDCYEYSRIRTFAYDVNCNELATAIEDCSQFGLLVGRGKNR